MDNLYEMEKFLKMYKLPKWLKKKLAVTNKAIKSVIKKVPDGFTGEFYQIFREEIPPLLPKLLQEIKGVNTL